MNITVLKVNLVILDAMSRSNKGSLVWSTYHEVIIMLKAISKEYDEKSHKELDPGDLNTMLKNMKLDDFLKN